MVFTVKSVVCCKQQTSYLAENINFCCEITKEIRCCRLLPVNKQSHVTFYYGDIALYYLITRAMLDTGDGGLNTCTLLILIRTNIWFIWSR